MFSGIFGSLISKVGTWVVCPFLTGNCTFNLGSSDTPGDENTSYSTVTMQLFDKNGNEIDPNRLGSDGSNEDDETDCDDSLCDNEEDPFFFKVVWEKPRSVDLFGVSKIEGWYKIYPLAAFAGHPMSDFWNEFKRAEREPDSSASTYLGNSAPEIFKGKEIGNKYSRTSLIDHRFLKKSS